MKKIRTCGLCTMNVTGNYRKVWLKILKEDTLWNIKHKRILKSRDVS